MNGHLEKAKAAVEAARVLDPSDIQYGDLLVIARIQADLAQADALERIAVALDRLALNTQGALL